MENFKQFDLNGLSTLWQASVRNPELRLLIEKELQQRIETNKNFSREFIFQICRMLNRVLGVYFVPSSEAHKRYGDYVTIVDILLEDRELIEMVTNYTAHPAVNTSGQMRAKLLASDQVTEDQINQMSTIGFHTQDILSTQHM